MRITLLLAGRCKKVPRRGMRSVTPQAWEGEREHYVSPNGTICAIVRRVASVVFSLKRSNSNSLEQD